MVQPRILPLQALGISVSVGHLAIQCWYCNTGKPEPHVTMHELNQQTLQVPVVTQKICIRRCLGRYLVSAAIRRSTYAGKTNDLRGKGKVPGLTAVLCRDTVTVP
ncbi:hypothetical protein F4806DRAFT_462657 [Annulohypoxylon nitens]|nr:hypothetical protein F4806DRAFT_462657 [Annulohypoxylon nitens]